MYDYGVVLEIQANLPDEDCDDCAIKIDSKPASNTEIAFLCGSLK